MKNQTLSIEQMKRLQDLGVDVSKASMVYHTYKDITDEWVERDDITSSHFKIDENSEPITSLDIRSSDERLYHDMNDCSNYSCCEFILAFTLQDILELLPNFISKDGYIYDLMSDMHNSMAYKIDWNELEDSSLIDVDDLYLHTESDGSNLLKMAYKMLCWVAENNYLNKEEQ